MQMHVMTFIISLQETATSFMKLSLSWNPPFFYFFLNSHEVSVLLIRKPTCSKKAQTVWIIARFKKKLAQNKIFLLMEMNWMLCSCYAFTSLCTCFQFVWNLVVGNIKWYARISRTGVKLIACKYKCSLHPTLVFPFLFFFLPTSISDLMIADLSRNPFRNVY